MRISFDRGTIVLGAVSAEAGAALDALPDVRWDPRTREYRAPGFRYRALVEGLRTQGIGFENAVRTRGVALSRANLWRPVELRAYQHAALLAWTAHYRGTVVLPTGSGKTRLACAAIAASRVPALCLVPTRALLHQWRVEIARHYEGSIGVIGDGQCRIEPVTVATFEGAYRRMDRLGDQFGLIVVDEIHHFGRGQRDEALEMCAAPRRLGLTASPPDGDGLKRIAELIGPIIFELRIGDLSGEWLADFDSFAIELRFTQHEQARYEASARTFRAVFDAYRELHRVPRWTEFVAMASRSEHGRAALAAFRATRRLTNYPIAKRIALTALLARHVQNRVLVFTPDNPTAYAIAREFLVMPITCDIDRKEREDAIAAFRAGELRVLVSAQVLNEGFDVPDADVAIIVGGTRGRREHVQRVGRLLRPTPGKRASIYELVVAGTHEQRVASDRRRALYASATSRG